MRTATMAAALLLASTILFAQADDEQVQRRHKAMSPVSGEIRTVSVGEVAFAEFDQAEYLWAGQWEVTSGQWDVTSGRLELTSGRSEVNSGRSEVTSGQSEVSSGQGKVTSGCSEVSSGRPRMTSKRGKWLSPLGQASSKRRAEKAGRVKKPGATPS